MTEQPQQTQFQQAVERELRLTIGDMHVQMIGMRVALEMAQQAQPQPQPHATTTNGTGAPPPDSDPKRATNGAGVAR